MDLYMLIPIIFIAFVGSMMSGGSLIVFTALTFLSMPIKTAVGTLKLSITVLGLASAGTYLKGGAVDVKKAPSLVLFSLLGAFLGSQIVISLPEETIRIIVILLLFVGTGASLRGIFKTEFREAPLEYSRLLPVIVGFALGVYIAMLGIASSILTISALVTLFHMPILQANGTGKMVIFANNLLACVVYLMNQSVDLIIGLTISVPNSHRGMGGCQNRSKNEESTTGHCLRSYGHRHNSKTVE
ncbi:hypothetical protein DRO59_01450 [Candidatus Bathyarchaeota archaeon]|nr:MAG: hypothetical protein DRO59_01450 [Candidatus Bathyarchaeota archaeon]